MLSVGENKQAVATTSPRGEQIPKGDTMRSCPRPASSRTEQGATGIAVVTGEIDNPQKMTAQLAARNVWSDAILAGMHWLHCPVTTPALGIPSGAGYLLQGCGRRDSSQPTHSTAARDNCGQGVTSCFERGIQLIPPKITRQHPKLGQPTRATLSSAEPQGSAVFA